MNHSRILEKPKADASDVIYTLTKAGLSAAPGGGSAAEVLSALFDSPLSKRREERMQLFAKGLVELDKKYNGILEKLSKNDAFITTAMQAMQISLRNHQKEKLEALRNVVLNAAVLSVPNEDMQILFLTFIDSFTPWHLRLLKFFDEGISHVKLSDVKKSRYFLGHASFLTGTDSTTLSEVIEYNFPELSGHEDFYKQLCKELSARGLIGEVHFNKFAGDFRKAKTFEEWQNAFSSRITPLGKQFLEFIAAPV